MIKHGITGTRLHAAWYNMMGRCYNKNRKGFKNYGGRGIEVCARWRKSMINFFNDMGHPPVGYSLERINNNGPYSPSNCKWIIKKDQRKNCRDVALISFNGKVLPLKAWAKELGFSKGALHYRLIRWGKKKAFTIQKDPSRERAGKASVAKHGSDCLSKRAKERWKTRPRCVDLGAYKKRW